MLVCCDVPLVVRNPSARLVANVRRCEDCLEYNEDLDASQLVLIVLAESLLLYVAQFGASFSAALSSGRKRQVSKFARCPSVFGFSGASVCFGDLFGLVFLVHHPPASRRLRRTVTSEFLEDSDDETGSQSSDPPSPPQSAPLRDCGPPPPPPLVGAAPRAVAAAAAPPLQVPVPEGGVAEARALIREVLDGLHGHSSQARVDLGAILVACAQVGSSRETFEVTYANAHTGTQLRVRSHREEFDYAAVALDSGVLARADSVLDDRLRQELVRRHALEVL